MSNEQPKAKRITAENNMKRTLRAREREIHKLELAMKRKEKVERMLRARERRIGRLEKLLRRKEEEHVVDRAEAERREQAWEMLVTEVRYRCASKHYANGGWGGGGRRTSTGSDRAS